MPGSVRAVADERDGLLSFLAHQRYVLWVAAHGLTDEQARLTPTAGTLSIGGLLKHVAAAEEGWMRRVAREPETDPVPQRVARYQANFTLLPDETLAGVLARYAQVAERTDAIVAGIDDLDRSVPVRQQAQWFPPDCSVRWVLLHLIEETARHAGHADIVRESVDGATAFPLLAAVENWPDTPWVRPWRPEA
jgi:uncharacterized damage-inducible protein DinB